MRLIAIAAAGVLLATANLVSASPLNSISPQLNNAPIELVQTQPMKKDETVTQKVKRVWRNWTTPSHSFCVRCPIPIPLTAKVCTAKGKTVDEARSVCVQQNPVCYVQAGKC
jgi:hypothetical protein